MLDLTALERIRRQVGEGVKIVAATKTVPKDILSDVKNSGIFAAGENRVQEFLTKYDPSDGINWHFIGQLQTNKVRQIVDKVSMIQSVDRIALVDEIDRQCAKIGKKMDILIELNAGEEAKGGVEPDNLPALIDYILAKPHLSLRGLMCVPPIDATREIYANVGQIFQSYRHLDGFDYLSMGMSGDYTVAVDCGANMIRLGSVLFGARNY